MQTFKQTPTYIKRKCNTNFWSQLYVRQLPDHPLEIFSLTSKTKTTYFWIFYILICKSRWPSNRNLHLKQAGPPFKTTLTSIKFNRTHHTIKTFILWASIISVITYIQRSRNNKRHRAKTEAAAAATATDYNKRTQKLTLVHTSKKINGH